MYEGACSTAPLRFPIRRTSIRSGTSDPLNADSGRGSTFRLGPRSGGIGKHTATATVMVARTGECVSAKVFCEEDVATAGRAAEGLARRNLRLVANRSMTMRADESPQTRNQNRVNMVLEHSLGFGNKSYGLLYDATVPGAKHANEPAGSPTSSAAPSPALANVVAGSPAPSRMLFRHEIDPATGEIKTTAKPPVYDSTFPWLTWDNRPYVSAEELLKVPAYSQSQMLGYHGAIDPNAVTTNHRDPYGLPLTSVPAPPSIAPANVGSATAVATNALRFAAMQAPFGEFMNVFATAALPADVDRDPTTGAPVLVCADPAAVPPKSGDIRPYGAPNFSRILEYVQVPSRFVGTDTMLNAETFNDNRSIASSTANPYEDILTAQVSSLSGSTINDPRYFFQPPFNKVSRERDPGRVNLNTVTGRRLVDATGVPRIWSEVYDGIMHRYKNPVTGAGDDNEIDNTVVPPATVQLGHFGPAWRDVALSRRGYVQIDAIGTLLDKPSAACGTRHIAVRPQQQIPNDVRQPIPFARRRRSGAGRANDAIWC